MYLIYEVQCKRLSSFYRANRKKLAAEAKLVMGTELPMLKWLGLAQNSCHSKRDPAFQRPPRDDWRISRGQATAHPDIYPMTVEFRGSEK